MFHVSIKLWKAMLFILCVLYFWWGRGEAAGDEIWNWSLLMVKWLVPILISWLIAGVNGAAITDHNRRSQDILYATCPFRVRSGQRRLENNWSTKRRIYWKYFVGARHPCERDSWASPTKTLSWRGICSLVWPPGVGRKATSSVSNESIFRVKHFHPAKHKYNIPYTD